MGIFGKLFGDSPAARSMDDRTEDFVARLPVFGALTGAETSSHRALVAKQQQMADEAKKRQRLNHQARMNALGQQMLAFNPMNQTMAQMFGPGAAFQPEQLAAMAADPMKPQLDPSLYGYQGTNDKKEAEIRAFMADKKQYDENEKRRREMLMGGLQPLPQGPAPIQQRAPLAAKRY
jgi:hypothetical protein